MLLPLVLAWWVRLLAVLALFAAGAADAAVQVRVGLYHTPPKVVALPGESPAGIYVELLQDFGRRTGHSFVYVPGTFEQGLQRLAAGEIDLMVDVVRVPEREASLDFTREPVLSTWNEVYARRGLGIRNFLQLQGRRVAVLDGSVQERFFRESARSFGLQAPLLSFPSFEAAFEAVRRGQADAVVANPYMAESMRRGLDRTAILFGPATVHFAVRQGANGWLLDALDRYLGEVKADPNSVYYVAYRPLQEAQRTESIPPWVMPAALASLALLLLALGWATTWRRAAARLRNLSAELQLVFEKSLDVICVLDEHLVLRNVSPAVRRFGFEPLELIGRPVLPMLLDAEVRTRVEAALREAAAGGSVTGRSAQLWTKAHQVVAISFSAAWSPESRQYYCILHDESERMTLLRQLQQRQVELERHNEELNIVSYSLSHDLRSPVAAIDGFVSVAHSMLDENGPPKVLHLLGRALHATKRVHQMLDDLGALLRVTGSALVRQPCDVSELARDVVAGLRARTDHAPAVSIAPGMEVQADPRLLKLALENLLGNAWKFTAQTAGAAITVGSLEDAQERIFFVRDNGAGFDMDYAQQLFRPFSRLHRQDEFAGTGMGLSIVQRIVTRHGGRIWAEGKPGAGATFYFTLDSDGADDAEAASRQDGVADPSRSPVSRG